VPAVRRVEILATSVRSNREIVESAYEGGPASFLSVVHPDAEWHWPTGMADTDVFRGRAEIERAVRLWTESWSDFNMEIRELLERGDTVLVIVRYMARGRASGVVIDRPVAHLWELRDGLAVRLRMFGDAQRAKQRFLS
jgi:ketosteroid isomerase-like protein